MKTFNQLVSEGCVTNDRQPGNSLVNTGVANHLTPVYNIVTNVRNLFSPLLGIVCSVADDGFSVKVHSSKFVNKQSVNAILNNCPYNNGLSLRQYIASQGLDKETQEDLGQYIVVYFSPSDIKAADPKAVKESNEDEIHGMINEDDEELENAELKELKEILSANNEDKFKAAKKFGDLIAKQMELPKDYYWAAVKLDDGETAIALRHKTTINRPHGKKIEKVFSMLYIFGIGDDALWIDGWDTKNDISDEDENLINNIITFLNAKETKDANTYSIKFDEEETKDDDKSDDSDDDSEEDTDEADKDKKDDVTL